MWRAGSNLGLGFPEKIRGLLCMRRSMGCLAAKRMSSESESNKEKAKRMSSETESESNKEKRLCLFFVERAGSYTSQVVRSIRLNSDDDDDDDDDYYYYDDDDDDERGDLFLDEVDYNRSSKVYKSWSFCTRFGSRIVLPTGTDDDGSITHFSLIKFPYSDSKTKLYRFSSPKKDPLLGELNGKLYCISNKLLPGESRSKPFCIGNTPSLSFENWSNLLEEKRKKMDLLGDDTLVRAKLAEKEKLIDRKVQPFEFLDSAENMNKPEWVPLDPPPFLNGNDFVVSFLEGSNRILGWECDEAGVYSFDTTNPENGWAESCSSLANSLPFLVWNRRPPFFIRDHHHHLGDFHLMFIYDPYRSLVISCFMSGNCDCFHIIRDTHLRLPEFYNDLDPKLPVSSVDFEFVHLGGQKVCLVLNKFFPHDHDEHKNTGILLVITFEYEIKPIIRNLEIRNPTIHLHYRLLGAQRFRYHSRQLRKTGCTKTDSVRMTGVFLL